MKKTSYLYNNPSFLKGVSRIWDITGNKDVYSIHDSEDEADTEALKNDWNMVKKDLTDSIRKYGKKIQNFSI